jgi:hypothetical protein
MPKPPTEAWLAWSIAALVAAGVFLLARFPLRGGIELDLTRGDDVGGWSQLTLVGFSVSGPRGRILPSEPGRQDLRIVSNRPLPAGFDVEIEAWSVRGEPPTPLEVAIGGESETLHFEREARAGTVRLRNPEGSRTISLRLEPERSLGVRRIAVRELASLP